FSRADDFRAVERPRIPRGEIKIPFLGPAVDQMKAGDRGTVFDAHTRLRNAPAAAVDDMAQVSHDRSLVAGRKSETQDARALTGGQFHRDAGFLELHLVITGRRR